MQKIVIADIITTWGGFYIENIKQANDMQLNQLEAKLTLQIDTTLCANLEEFGYLHVSWHTKNTTSLAEKIKIVKIINEIFYSPLIKTT